MAPDINVIRIYSCPGKDGGGKEGTRKGKRKVKTEGKKIEVESDPRDDFYSMSTYSQIMICAHTRPDCTI